MGVFNGVNFFLNPILFVDSSNIKCYKGESTTNILSNFNFTEWNKTGLSAYELPSEFNFEKRKTYKIVLDTQNSMHRIYYSEGAVLSTGQTYTFSLYAKQNGYNYISIGASDSTNYQAISTFNLSNGSHEKTYTSNGGVIVSSKSYYIDYGWYRVEVSLYLNSFIAKNYFMIFISNVLNEQPYLNSIGNNVNGVLISSPQIEQKGYSTPFVVGSRGVNSNSGGGIVDLSIFKNNMNFNNSIKYIKDKKGAFLFEGNGYFSLPIYPNNFTFSVWFNATDGYIVRRQSYGWGIYVNPVSVYTWVDVDSNHRSLIQNIPNDGIMNITISFGNYRFKVYKNGEKIKDVFVKSDTIYGTKTSFNIGADGVSNGFLNGKIYNFKLYDVVLDSSVIKDSYNSLKNRFK